MFSLALQGILYSLLHIFTCKLKTLSFASCGYVDCKKEDEIREFCFSTANAEKIIEFISLQKGRQIDSKTLLIFDEVQECPNIISALKYFCQDFKEIPVIATGSMVRIKLQRETNKRGAGNNSKFLFPVGKINQITI